MNKKTFITGSSGFLGSNFIKINKDKFSVIYANTRNKTFKEKNIINVNIDLTNESSIYDFLNLNSIDLIIHFAFDHSYSLNYKILNSLINASIKHDLSKFIHISTISVLKLENNKINLDYNNYFDPYSYTKRRLEKLLVNYNDNLNYQIIYPTIVYGEGGNWSKFIQRCLSANSFGLPLKGLVNCNVIHVTNFSTKLYKAINTNNLKVIIGDENLKWKNLYLKHSENKKIFITETKNSYHDNSLLNIIFLVWHKTFLGVLFTFLLSLIYRYKPKSKQTTDNKVNKYISPIFSNRIIHKTNFKL